MEKVKAKDFEPDEGWWKSYTEKSIKSAIENLRESGVPEETIYNVIDTVKSAMMGEYGE